MTLIAIDVHRLRLCEGEPLLMEEDNQAIVASIRLALNSLRLLERTRVTEACRSVAGSARCFFHIRLYPI